MEPTTNFMPPRDLTGQVSILDIVPKFTGNYSSVFLGALNGRFVAIKVIKATGRDESVNRKVIREVTLWAATNHRNIYPFYGVINDPWCGPFGALVSPWCLNGDANQYLSQNGGRMVTAERVNLWRGVIEGVAYLHRHKPVIVHGDLKPGNILIDDRGVPRICDFGLARVLHEGESMGMTTTSEHTGTERYLAPELVISEENVQPTTASDVYALGCLGLEFIYDQKPYSHRANNLRGRIIVDIRRQLPPATHPPYRSWVVNHFWPLIQQLWNIDPRYRPSSFNAVLRLRMATRDIPSRVLQLIVELSDIPNGKYVEYVKWNKRTSCVRNLCLVSRSFQGLATPLLYRNIAITHQQAFISLSKLKYTLENTVANTFAYGADPTGYGHYTKRFCVRLPDELNLSALSSEIQDIVGMMSGLRLVKIFASEYGVRVEDFGSSTLSLTNVDASCILGYESFLHAMPYLERLIIDGCGMERDADQDVTPMQYGVLILPNLQEIEVSYYQSDLSDFCGAFTHWVIPNLRTLKFHLWAGLKSSYAAFTSLIRVHGPSLWHLTLGLHNWQSSPLMEVLSLCNSLRYFAFDSLSYTQILHFPVHATLERLDLTNSGVEELTEEACKLIVQEFASRWRAYLPSLRIVNFEWEDYDGEQLSATFRSEDNFYTLNGEDGINRSCPIFPGAPDMSDT